MPASQSTTVLLCYWLLYNLITELCKNLNTFMVGLGLYRGFLMRYISLFGPDKIVNILPLNHKAGLYPLNSISLSENTIEGYDILHPQQAEISACFYKEFEGRRM